MPLFQKALLTFSLHSITPRESLSSQIRSLVDCPTPHSKAFPLLLGLLLKTSNNLDGEHWWKSVAVKAVPPSILSDFTKMPTKIFKYFKFSPHWHICSGRQNAESWLWTVSGQLIPLPCQINWDSRLVNKKVSSVVLKFFRFKNCIVESILCHKTDAHPSWARRQGRAGEGQAWALSLLETSKNWWLSSLGAGRGGAFLLVCVSQEELSHTEGGHPRTKEKPFKAEPSLSQRQHSLFDLKMNQAGFVLLNSSLNSTFLQIGKAWIDVRLGWFKNHFFLPRAKLSVSHGGNPHVPTSRPCNSPRSCNWTFAGVFPMMGGTEPIRGWGDLVCSCSGLAKANSTTSNTLVSPSSKTSPLLLFHYCSIHKRPLIKSVASCLMNQESIHPVIFLPSSSFPEFHCHIQ